MGESTLELMRKHVEEGEWNGFFFRRATPEDEEIIEDLVKSHFFPDEPISKLQGVTKDYEEDFKKLYMSFFDDHLTFLAIHKESGRAAGFRLTFAHDQNKDWSGYQLKSPEILRLLKAVTELDEQTNVFEKYGVTTYADLLQTCVHTDFRKMGLVGEMYRRSIALARARGFVLAKATFSSPYSRKAAANQGFTQIGKVELKDMKDKNGVPVFPTATDQMVTQAVYLL